MKADQPIEGGKNRWLKRIGIAGFLFFLIKGLIWLGLLAWMGKSIWD